MIPQHPPRVSLRNVRRATQASLDGLNQHANVLNEARGNIAYLKTQLDETQRKLADTTNRLDSFIALDAFMSRSFLQRLRFLFLGR